MRNVFYTAGMNEAIKLLGQKNPNLDASDLDDQSESTEEALKKKSEVATK